MRKGKNEMVAGEVKEKEMEMEMENVMEVKEIEMENAMEVKEMVKNEMEGVDMNFAGVMDALKGMKLNNDEIKELRSFVKGLKLERGEEGGRKEELIELLNKEGRLNIKEIGGKMGISAKNVSSLLMYLKKDGVRICTDCEGRKFIEK